MKTTNISRYIALLLRHHPEKAGLCLDEHGWVEVTGADTVVANEK